MSDKPILFSAPMIRALLDGRKTQTRRVYKPREGRWGIDRRFAPGDRLWVRETWQEFLASEFPPGRTFGPRGDFGIPAERTKGNVSYVAYRADGDFPPHPEDGIAVWRSPIHMPRKFSRLTLIVEAVKVERLQDISEEDAIAEGVFVPEAQYAQQGPRAPVLAYAALWDSINGACAWEANPWCVALTFRVKQRNIDATPTPENSHD